MLALVYKDIILQRDSKTTLVIIGIMCLVASVTLTTNATYGYFAVIMTAYLMVNYVHAYDFKYKTEALFRSLPVSTDMIVGSRYVSSLMYLAAPVIVVIVLRLALCAAGMFPLRSLIRIELLVQIFGIAVLYFSIYLPLYFRLGYMKCRWINMIGMGVSFGVPLSLVKIAEELMKDGSIPRPDTWHETAQEALALFTGTSVRLWNLLLLITALVVLFLSFRIALRVFRGRDCAV